MGLDVSHGAWHGAYSAFMRWRLKIAEVAGIPLKLMEGFYGSPGGYGTWDEAAKGKDIDGVAHWPFNAYYKEVAPYLPIKWESLRPDPLHALLNHSDCDGEISSRNCAEIAGRLEELLPLLPNGDAPGHIGNWRDKTSQFMEGCRAAAEANEELEFH